jgi:hypothetical protein
MTAFLLENFKLIMLFLLVGSVVTLARPCARAISQNDFEKEAAN